MQNLVRNLYRQTTRTLWRQ